MNKRSVRPILPESRAGTRSAAPASGRESATTPPLVSIPERGTGYQPVISFTRAGSPCYVPAQIISISIALAVCLIPVRAVVLGFNLWSLTRPFQQIPEMIIAACYDVMLVTVVAITFLILTWMLKRWRTMQRMLVAMFLLLAMALLLVGIANIEIVRMLGRPFNYQWLYYSDFLRNGEALHSVVMSLDWKSAALATWLCLAMLMIAKITQWIAALLRRCGMRAVTIFAAAVPLLGAYLLFSHWFLMTQQYPAGKLANPVAEFAISLIRSARAPALFTMSTPVSFDEFAGALSVNSGSHPASQPSSLAPHDPHVRNVIFFVLESVPAEYVQAYGGRFPVTPNLNRYLERAAVFENIYSHAASTSKSLVSLLCSAYPWVSYHTLTQEFPDVSLAAITRPLRRRGLRTAFFASGDLDFQGAGNFLSHRGFDLIQDYRDRRNARRSLASREVPYLHGTDDRATVGSLLEWIDKQPHKPFFATLWTVATHHPYFSADREIDFGVSDASFNRYLNALRETDEALGELLDALQQRDLLDSTLVVVVADHGEAFGRHNQWGHGTHLYDENLRVPLILINPRLFKGERSRQVGGLVDVAPTVADILRIEPGRSWQGRSLWAPNRTGRAYFFAPWSDLLFGYREHDWKLIFNATTNQAEVYDLKTDPLEMRNLAARFPQFVERGQQYLAAWVQHQARYYARATGQEQLGMASAPPGRAAAGAD